MKIGEQFVCRGCGFNEYLNRNDIMDEDENLNIPCYTCPRCEQSVCYDCEERHTETKCGDKPEIWFYCQGCGYWKRAIKLAPKQEEYCITCQEAWEAQQLIKESEYES